MPYVPLHVHSVNSPYYGMLTPEELVSRALFLKMPAVALTDRWTTYGHHEFHRHARKAGIKPILGAEIQHLSLTGKPGIYHLTLLAENIEGYRNLVALVSKHFEKEKGQFVTEEEMTLRSAGLIALTGCLKGETSQAVIHGNLSRESKVVEKLIDIYGRGNVFLEVMNHNLEAEMFIIDQFLPLSRKLNIPMVATNNDRFILREQGEYYGLLRKLGSPGEENGGKENLDEYHLKKGKDLEPYFYVAGEALEESGRIAERCDVELESSRRIVFSETPDPDGTLAEMASRRFLLRYHGRGYVEKKELEKILSEELRSAAREGLSGFVLFLMRFFHSCRSRGLRLEPMGSEILQSFTAHLLGVTPLDPVENGMVFESFNSSRPGVPAQLEMLKPRGAWKLLMSLLKGLLPGHEISGQLVREEMSFTTLVREIAGIMEMTGTAREELFAALPTAKKKPSLQEMLEGSEPMARLYKEDNAARMVMNCAQALSGRVHHFNQSTARIIVLPRGAGEQVSRVAGQAGERFLMLDSVEVEDVGGWVLGVQRSHFLSALEMTVKNLRKRSSLVDADAEADPRAAGSPEPEHLDDPAVFDLIRSGNTAGIYLLESRGIRDLLTKLDPNDFNELVNVISLYRPAPLEGKLWQKYLENAEKKGRVYLPHHSLAAQLEKTRGLLLYREQVREIIKTTTALTGAKVKRIEKALQTVEAGSLFGARLDFIREAMENGIDEENAQKIFDFLLHNIKFTYEKGFSCAQAYISYRTAFFKARHHDVYFAALLNCTSDVRERQKKYMEYLESVNKAVLPADANSSAMEYSAVPGGIRMPLNESGALNDSELEKVIAERERNGPFSSLEIFLERMSSELSMMSVNNMIDAGLFDYLLVKRAEMRDVCLGFYEKHGRAGDFFRPPAGPPRNRRENSSRQLSFFDDDGENG